MPDQWFVAATALIIIGLIGSQVPRKAFDPFAPIWLFLIGYAQVYVVQAIMYRDYALRARGLEVVTLANSRALWALVWFLVLYYSGIGRAIAARLPRAPSNWSPGLVCGIAPPMVLWGLICAGLVIIYGEAMTEISAEANLLFQFPIMMLVAGILLIVTGRSGGRTRPVLVAIGLSVAALYMLIWMFNGKRSHALFGVLTALCAYYISRGKRPSMPVLIVAAFLGMLAVSVAIGWRSNYNYERSFSGFFHYVSEFRLESILVNLNLKEAHEVNPEMGEQASKETEEYGGYLLMLDTVPAKADYDYGASYLRLVSTYIPRVVWPDKPVFGREEWVAAWIAGSEFPRDSTFTGPAISILGATQLNGGAVATVIVLGVLAILLRTAYEYFRLYAATPWAQAWWALTYYNAWLMTVNDDPFVWFYYIYGHTTLPPLACLWLYHRLTAPRACPGMSPVSGGSGPVGAHPVC